MSDNFFRNAAEENVLETRVTVGGEDDEVALFLFRNLRDFLPRTPEADKVAGFYIRAPRKVAELLDDLLTFFRSKVRGGERRIHPVAGINHLLHDMNERDLRAKLRGKPKRIAQGFLGVIGKIHGHKNALDFELKRSKRTRRHSGSAMARTVNNDKFC